MPFPKQFPLDCATTLVDFFRGDGNHSVDCAVECTYDLVGWGLGLRFDSNHPHVIGSTVEECPDCPDCSDDENCAKALEELVNCCREDEPGVISSSKGIPPWVLPLVLQLFDLLRERLR